MTFTQILSERVKEHPLITYTLDIDCIQGLLEEMCMRLDQLNNRVQNAEEAVQGKASFSDMENFKDDVNNKVDQLALQIQNFDDKIDGINTMCNDRLKKMEDELESQINNCLVEAGRIVKSSIEEMEPEITKHVIEAMPSVDGLMKQNEDAQKEVKKMTDKMNDISKQLEQLAMQDAALQEQIDEVNENIANQPVAQGTSAQPAQPGQAPPPVPSTTKLQKEPTAKRLSQVFSPMQDRIQEDMNKLRDELTKMIKDQDAKIKQVDDSIEQARDYTTQQINAARNDLTASDRNIEQAVDQLKNKVSNLDKESQKEQKGPEIPSDLVDKVNGLHKDLLLMNEKVINLHDDLNLTNDQLKALKDGLEAPPPAIEAPVVVDKDTGEIDLSPITNTLHHLGSELKVLSSRIEILEKRKQISPEALSGTRDLATKCVDRLNALEGRLSEDVSSISSKIDHDLFAVREEILNECKEIKDIAQNAKDAAEASTRTGEETMRLLQKTRTELTELGMKVNELGARDSNDDKIDKLSSALASLSTTFNAHTDQTKSYADKFDELIKYHAQDKSEITELWKKFNELSKELSERSESFIPSKIELINPRKQTIVVSRGAESSQSEAPKTSMLPRIQNRSIIDDSKLDSTNAKVEKQENVLASLRRQVDQHTKLIQQLDDCKADKVSAQSLFEQFRIAMGELNNRLLTLKRNLLGKADIAEVHKLLQQSYDSNDTAGAYEPVKCICCGRPRTGVVNALDDNSVRRPPPTSSRAITDAEGQVCFVYGEHGDMYIGRSNDGRSRFLTKPQGEDPSTPPASTRKQ